MEAEMEMELEVETEKENGNGIGKRNKSLSARRNRILDRSGKPGEIAAANCLRRFAAMHGETTMPLCTEKLICRHIVAICTEKYR